MSRLKYSNYSTVNQIDSKQDHQIRRFLSSIHKLYNQHSQILNLPVTSQQPNQLLIHIRNKHLQNKQKINDLLDLAKQLYSIQIIDQNEQVNPQWNEVILVVQGILKDLESLQEKSLIDIIDQVVDKSQISYEYVKQFCDSLSIRNKDDMLKLIQIGYNPIKTNQEIDIESYLQTQIGQLAIRMIIQKIQTSTSSIEYALNQRQLDIIHVLFLDNSESDLGSQILNNPTLILDRFQIWLSQLQQRADKTNLLQSQFNELKNRINNYIVQKYNFESLIEKQFEGCQQIGYKKFSTKMKRLNLNLSLREIDIIFRYCLLKQKGLFTDIIDRGQTINCKKCLTLLLNTTQIKQNSNKNNQIQLRSQINNLSKRNQNLMSAVEALASDKQKLLMLLSSKENCLSVANTQKLQHQLKIAHQITTLKQQYNQQISLLKLKGQNDRKQLRRVNEDQSRVIQSYRIELQNIMKQIEID